MSSRDKVAAIFQELAGDAAKRLAGDRYLADVNTRITAALAQSVEEGDLRSSDMVGFHLIDWQAEAAFIVALCLYPERFTDEEIQSGVVGFLIHAPSHVVAAAKTAGYAINDFPPSDEKKD